MDEQKRKIENMAMNNLPIIYPMTAKIMEEADEETCRASMKLQEMDISELTVEEIVDLIFEED